MIVRAREIGETFETKLGPLEVEDTKLYINPGGPFIRYLLMDGLEALVADMKQRVENHFDNFVIIAGGEGSGKSNLAWQIIHIFDPDTDPSSHLIYTAKQLRNHLRKNSSPGQIFWLDELYELASKREWNDPDTRWLINLLVRGRNRGWSFIGCIPREKDSDEYIRDHRASHALKCEPQDFDHSQWLDRGYAEIQKRDISGSLQHVGYLRYPPIPEGAAEIYEAAKWHDQDEMLGAPEKEAANTYRERYEAQTAKLSTAILMLKDAGIPRAEICEKLKIPEATYYRMVRNAKSVDVEAVDDDDQE